MKTSSSLQVRNTIVKVLGDHFEVAGSYNAKDVIEIVKRHQSFINTINGFVIVCDLTKGLYEYVSDGIKSSLGYDLSNYPPEALTGFLVSLVDEKQMKFMIEDMMALVYNHFKSHPSEVMNLEYRYNCCAKVKNVYNEYKWFVLDTLIVEVDDFQNPVKTLITCTNIDQFKKDNIMYYSIMKKNDDGIYRVVYEGTVGQQTEYNLTSREIEIINLIGNGFTNKQIAHKLSISLNTVQTHRKNILKKTKCNGTAELATFAFSRGLL